MLACLDLPSFSALPLQHVATLHPPLACLRHQSYGHHFKRDYVQHERPSQPGESRAAAAAVDVGQAHDVAVAVVGGLAGGDFDFGSVDGVEAGDQRQVAGWACMVTGSGGWLRLRARWTMSVSRQSPTCGRRTKVKDWLPRSTQS